MSIFNFFREVKGEMKHMSWPTRKQTITYTILVILISLFVGVWVGLFDHLFAIGVEQIAN